MGLEGRGARRRRDGVQRHRTDGRMRQGLQAGDAGGRESVRGAAGGLRGMITERRLMTMAAASGSEQARARYCWQHCGSECHPHSAGVSVIVPILQMV